MDITTSQVRRLAKRYQREGLAGLISSKRGCALIRRLDETLRATAIQLIRAHYCDFGPTLACEKLDELHGMHLPVESIRQLMIIAGYWKTKRGGVVCAHPIRERRARFGELIQIDVKWSIARWTNHSDSHLWLMASQSMHKWIRQWHDVIRGTSLHRITLGETCLSASPLTMGYALLHNKGKTEERTFLFGVDSVVGKWMRKVHPLSGLLCTEILPLWASTIAKTKLRPRPRPFVDRLLSPR